MSNDLISRQAAIDALNEYFARIGKLKRRGLTKGEKAISLDTVGVIETLPSAQLEIEPKTGQWKEILVHRNDKGDILRDYECTNCLGIICDVPDDDEKELPRFCCMCGAEMEGGTE